MLSRGFALRNFVDKRPLFASLALVALTLLTHAIILATPGFFSNDEWQKFDHVQARGLLDFARNYGVLYVGPEFSHPLRPIGFLQQGIASLWMQSAPWIAHLIGVANHALVALVFVWVLRRAGVAPATAALAGVLFVISPLTTMATGWVAASFDQLYVLFLLLVAAAVLRPPRQGWSIPRSACIVLATIAALLSKETAIVAPAMILLLGYLAWARDPSQAFSWRPYLLAFALTAIPVAAYLAYRSPAIAASFGDHAVARYIPAASNMPANAIRYFAFPFRIKLVEMSAAAFSSPWQPGAAALAHLILVGAVFRLFGMRFALAYIAGYFLLLLPVLALPDAGPHYLYGSALTMSIALAAVARRIWATRSIGAGLLVTAGVTALLAHALIIQLSLYSTGVCQSRFLDAVDRALAHDDKTTNEPLRVIAEQGAPARTAVRAVAYRERYTVDGKIEGLPRIIVERVGALSSPPSAALEGGRDVWLTAACALSPRPLADR